MGNPEIRSRFDNSIIIKADKYTSIREAGEENRANLRGADLRGANLWGANLWGADLRDANLWGADLRGADLRGANLRGANLWGANLRGADLRGANLWGADLRGADLRDAEYKEPLFLPDLYLLKCQLPDTKLRAWKYLENGGKSPYQNFQYEINKTYKFDDCNTDEHQTCERGGNIATLVWCLKDSMEANEFMEVEFKVKDLVVPYATDGKFRVGEFKTLRIINRKEAVKILTDAMDKK